MSEFKCPVVRVESVIDHPNADRLSIIKLVNLGYTCISAKLDDLSHRYKVGDLVAYIPSSSVLPPDLLQIMGFWDSEAERGTLSGSNGNRVKPMKLRGIFSEGLLYPFYMINIASKSDNVLSDVSDILGIKKYEPPIPVAMAGQLANLTGYTLSYDFERWESVPDIFEPGEMVVVSEKLHGTMTAILFHPNLNHPEMFGKNGEIVVHSKGLGARGLAFKNVPENQNNLYVRQLQILLDSGLEDKMRSLSETNNNSVVCVVGETYGQGVQDLTYGLSKPEFSAFDISVNGQWLTPHEFSRAAITSNLPMVPTPYVGPFDLNKIIHFRDGRSFIGGQNIREGLVVRSIDGSRHPEHGRRIAKFISPDYLLRKSNNATEFN